MSDPLGAFCHDETVRVSASAPGPLNGLRFAAKDLFDVAGHVTGCGNPDWRRTHPPARHTASAVQRLLDAGARLVGKTITDELAFSLQGQNAHYGTPQNPNAPGRIPGGSSCGSASAVAGRAVDFAVGTDTGGSVRVPAGLCGIYGFRPGHDAVPIDGVMPLAPSFDVVGWFARDADMLARVGDVLLPADGTSKALVRSVVAEDAFEHVDPAVAKAVRDAIATVATVCPVAQSRGLSSLATPEVGELDAWMDAFRTLQGRQIWATHGEWIEAERPHFGADIEGRFAWSRTISPAQAAAAAPVREAVRRGLDAFLADGTVLCLPTTPCVAPRLDADDATTAAFRTRTLTLTCISGLGGVPQVTLPAGRVPSRSGDGPYPVGLSLIAARGSDRALLDLARRIVPPAD